MWSIRTLDDSALVNSDLILSALVNSDPDHRSVRTLTTSQFGPWPVVYSDLFIG